MHIGFHEKHFWIQWRSEERSAFAEQMSAEVVPQQAKAQAKSPLLKMPGEPDGSDFRPMDPLESGSAAWKGRPTKSRLSQGPVFILHREPAMPRIGLTPVRIRFARVERDLSREA
jgi:hypothetical protein